ncbi:MAG: hypothetical protein R2693_09690 [Nocardioidaceae bacterium]
MLPLSRGVVLLDVSASETDGFIFRLDEGRVSEDCEDRLDIGVVLIDLVGVLG